MYSMHIKCHNHVSNLWHKYRMYEEVSSLFQLFIRNFKSNIQLTFLNFISVVADFGSSKSGIQPFLQKSGQISGQISSQLYRKPDACAAAERSVN